MCCDGFNSFGDGRAIFARGDFRARMGLRELSRARCDIECGILDMERGMRRAVRNNRFDDGCRSFRNQFCRCICRHGHGHGGDDGCRFPGCDCGGLGRF